MAKVQFFWSLVVRVAVPAVNAVPLRVKFPTLSPLTFSLNATVIELTQVVLGVVTAEMVAVGALVSIVYV